MGERSARRKRSNGGKPRKRRPLKRPRQLELTTAYRGRGGPRPGAGRRPGKGRRPEPHRRRPQVRKDRPLHVTIRLLAGLPTLRRAKEFRAIRSAIWLGQRDDFAIVHFSVMGNHVHLIVEADHQRALTRGMQGLKVRIAKRLNGIWNRRKGEVFAERYHATEIASPMQARSTLLYVLCNARKHARESRQTLPTRWVDPFSSARQFHGWRQNVRIELGVVRTPSTWLLHTGWQRHGEIDAHAVPSGPAP